MGDGEGMTHAAGSLPSDVTSPPGTYVGDPAVQAEWDRRYAEQDRLWSGQPNSALVAEVAGLVPGRVLDVGCGDGLTEDERDTADATIAGAKIARGA